MRPVQPGALGPMHRAAFGCMRARLHRATTASPGTGANKGKRKAGSPFLGGGKGRPAYLRAYSTLEEGLGIYREGAICSQKQEISYPTKSPSKVTSGSVPTGAMFAHTVANTMHNSDHSPVPIGLGPPPNGHPAAGYYGLVVRAQNGGHNLS